MLCRWLDSALLIIANQNECEDEAAKMRHAMAVGAQWLSCAAAVGARP